jgi:hypothetical protein
VRSGWRRSLWLLTGTAAILAAAQWLRVPSVPYLAASVVATAATLAAAIAAKAERRWASGFAAAMFAFAVAAAIAQRTTDRIDHRWSEYRADIELGAVTRLERALELTSAELTEIASRALDAPAEPKAAFEALDRLVARGRRSRTLLPGVVLDRAGASEVGLVVYRGGTPAAWAGRTRVPTDSLDDRLGVVSSAFYLTLYATAQRGDVRAVATALVHADPPATRLAEPLDAIVARQAGVRGYEYIDAAARQSGFTMFAPHSDTLFGARPLPITPSEARLRAVEEATRRGTVLLATALAFLLVGAWVRPPSLPTPLSSNFSNNSPVIIKKQNHT